MKFSITDFFSKCDQVRRKLRIWSHLLKKSLMENFIFCAVNSFTSRVMINCGKNNSASLFKLNTGNIKEMKDISSKLTIKKSERHQWHRSGFLIVLLTSDVSTVNFEQINNGWKSIGQNFGNFKKRQSRFVQTNLVT